MKLLFNVGYGFEDAIYHLLSDDENIRNIADPKYKFWLEMYHINMKSSDYAVFTEIPLQPIIHKRLP